jgi:hypothetical protein
MGPFKTRNNWGSGASPVLHGDRVYVVNDNDEQSFLAAYDKRTGVEIWKKKLDWIAEHQGMVLLNVHPDYIDFVDANGSSQQYPVAHYRELLEYVRDRYAGRFWHALPRDVAAYCARFKPEHPCPAGAGHSVPNSSTSNYPGWLGWASLFEAVASQ